MARATNAPSQQGARRRAPDDFLALALIVASLISFGVIAVLALTRVEDFSSDTVVGLVAALVPGVITVIIAALGYADRKRDTAERREIRESERYEKIVVSALDYFTHGTQRRNIGISAVQGAWRHTPDLRPIFLPLLVNQAVYLLEESRQKEAQHERENLGRIMPLVIDSRAADDFPLGWYRPLIESLDRRRSGGVAHKGVAVDSNDLRRWRDGLDASVSHPL